MEANLEQNVIQYQWIETPLSKTTFQTIILGFSAEINYNIVQYATWGFQL